MHWVWATLAADTKNTKAVLLNLAVSPTMMAVTLEDGTPATRVLTGGVAYNPQGQVLYGHTMVRETPEELLALPMARLGKPANGYIAGDPQGEYAKIIEDVAAGRIFDGKRAATTGYIRPVKTRAKR
jgi:hypothetical protein